MELLLVDLGGVVVRIDPARIRDAWGELSDLDAEEVTRRLRPDAAYEAFERGEIDEPTFLDAVRRRLETDAPDEELLSAFNSLFLGIDEAVLGLLGELASSVRVSALSNTNETHARWWAARYADRLGVFDRVHLSHELGARKPERAVFRTVLDLEGVDPERTVFVDDRPENVAAARETGLRALRFEGAAGLRDDLATLLG